MAKLERENVRVVQVTAWCEDCRRSLQYSGEVLTSMPASYPHHCPKCGRRYDLPQVSPWVEYEVVDEEGV